MITYIAITIIHDWLYIHWHCAITIITNIHDWLYKKIMYTKCIEQMRFLNIEKSNPNPLRFAKKPKVWASTSSTG